MRDNKRSFSPPTIGGSSLLVIFAVLCLTVFALLSLSTVQADGRLSDKTLEATESYYRADSKAEEILAELRSGQVPDGVTRTDLGQTEGEAGYSYAVKITDSQALAVDVIIKGQDYEILRWQAVSTADWKANEGLNVWTGE